MAVRHNCLRCGMGRIDERDPDCPECDGTGYASARSFGEAVGRWVASPHFDAMLDRAEKRIPATEDAF